MARGTQIWEPEEKDYIFIKANRNVMSVDDFADYFKVEPYIIAHLLCEMGITLEFEADTGSYSLCFFMERWHRAFPNFINREYWRRFFEFRAMVMG